MRAGGKFGHHATEGGMQIELAENHIGQDLAGAVGEAAHNSGRGLVAACLDSQNINASGGHARPCGFQKSGVMHGARVQVKPLNATRMRLNVALAG
jgi:hypothetical protein